MSNEQLRSVAVRWFEEGWNGGDLSAADEVFTEDFVYHGRDEVGVDWLKAEVQRWRSAYPDLRVTIEDFVPQGDRAGIRLAFHTGGDTFAGGGIARFSEGRIAEYWGLVTGEPPVDGNARTAQRAQESKEALVRRWFEGAWNSGDVEIADEVFTDDFVYHARGPAVDRAWLKRLVQEWRYSYPGLRATVEDLFVTGDRAVVRWSFKGEGKTSTGGGIARFDGDRIAEFWGLTTD